MEKVLRDLYATEPTTLDFAPRSSVRAFLLQRPTGNVLLYASTRVSADDAAVRALGGIDRIYLSHWHEAGFGADRIGAPVYVDRADRRDAEAQSTIAGTFDEWPIEDEGLQFITIPGHTPGSTAFLATIEGDRVLFTGDSIWFGQDGWKVAVLPTSDRAAYIDSLERLRTVAFDIIVPSFAPLGGAFVERVTAAERDERFAHLIARVRSGEDR